MLSGWHYFTSAPDTARAARLLQLLCCACRSRSIHICNRWWRTSFSFPRLCGLPDKMFRCFIHMGYRHW